MGVRWLWACDGCGHLLALCVHWLWASAGCVCALAVGFRWLQVCCVQWLSTDHVRCLLLRQKVELIRWALEQCVQISVKFDASAGSPAKEICFLLRHFSPVRQGVTRHGPPRLSPLIWRERNDRSPPAPDHRLGLGHIVEGERASTAFFWSNTCKMRPVHRVAEAMLDSVLASRWDRLHPIYVNLMVKSSLQKHPYWRLREAPIKLLVASLNVPKESSHS